jgi:hypothetical protein
MGATGPAVTGPTGPGWLPTTAIQGVTDGSVATPGNLGETGCARNASSPNYDGFAASSIYENVCAVSLQPGSYMFSGQVQVCANGAVLSGSVGGAISLKSGADVSDAVTGDNYVNIALHAASGMGSCCISGVVVNSAVPFTVYLKALATFTAGGPLKAGRLTWQRIR